MKRLARIMFLILSALFLLFMGAGWIAAVHPSHLEHVAVYRIPDTFLDGTTGPILTEIYWQFQITRAGTLQIDRVRRDNENNLDPGRLSYSNWYLQDGPSILWQIYDTDAFLGTRYFLGFSYANKSYVHSTQYLTRYHTWKMGIPAWFLIPLFSLYPLRFAWRASRNPLRPGLCPKCSYDLRAHRPGDKCPECGTDIPTTLRP